MVKVNRINTSQIEGGYSNSADKRTNGEMALYNDDNGGFDLVIHDGTNSTDLNKVLGKGKLYGHGADSADGNGYDTIKLIPDIPIYNSGSHQYLIVDPTGPNHVHLRAGGTIDNSNSELIVGGEHSNVKVGAGTNPSIHIKSNDYNWTYNTSGEFIGPNGATIGSIGEGFPAFYNSNINNPVIIANKNIDSGAEIATAIFQPSPSGSGGLVQIMVAGTGIDHEYWGFRNNGVLELASGGIKFADNSVLNSSSGLGGNPFDQNLNTTDFPTFSGVNLTNNSSLAEGSFDSGIGGSGGISLNCAVGYELNWQAGHLRNIVTGDNTGTIQTIYCDSPIQFPGSGSNYMTVDPSGITFPDGTTQNSAASNLPTVVQLGSVSGTINTDASLGDIFDLTITASGILANPTNPTDGETLRWRIVHGADNVPISLGSNFKIPSTATSPLPFSTASGVMDVLGATYHAGRNKWDIIAFVPGY